MCSSTSMRTRSKLKGECNRSVIPCLQRSCRTIGFVINYELVCRILAKGIVNVPMRHRGLPIRDLPSGELEEVRGPWRWSLPMVAPEASSTFLVYERETKGEAGEFAPRESLERGLRILARRVGCASQEF